MWHLNVEILKYKNLGFNRFPASLFLALPGSVIFNLLDYVCGIFSKGNSGLFFTAIVLNIRCICNQSQRKKERGQINLSDVAGFLPVTNQLLTMAQKLIRHFIFYFLLE